MVGARRLHVFSTGELAQTLASAISPTRHMALARSYLTLPDLPVLSALLFTIQHVGEVGKYLTQPSTRSFHPTLTLPYLTLPHASTPPGPGSSTTHLLPHLRLYLTKPWSPAPSQIPS
jgi:hypothetical protein